MFFRKNIFKKLKKELRVNQKIQKVLRTAPFTRHVSRVDLSHKEEVKKRADLPDSSGVKQRISLGYKALRFDDRQLVKIKLTPETIKSAESAEQIPEHPVNLHL